jgi:hypothetical protein
MKIERAKRHMEELESVMRVFFDSKPYRFSGKPDTRRRCVQYTMDTAEPVPPEIPLVVGDVIQNLRSALDQVAYQLYLKGGDGHGRAYLVSFPIFDSFKEYQREKLRKLPGVSAAAVAKIDAIQPYKGGNDVLWVLNKLNNIDKHRLLLTVGSAVRGIDVGKMMFQSMAKIKPGIQVTKEHSMFFAPKDNSYPLEVGTLVFTDQTTLEIVDVNVAFEIVLYEKEVVQGKPVYEFLNTMITVVETTISDLRPLI